MLPRRAVAVKSRTNKSTFSFFGANQRDSIVVSATHAHNPLEERLHQIVVFELREDGGTEYSTMTLRAFYNYVVALITESCRIANIERQSSIIQRESRKDNRSISFDSPTSATSSLNASLLHHDNLSSQQQDRSSQQKIFHKPHKERLGGYLHPRDMRRLVTPFSSSNEPQLMVRRHVMLLNFDPLRAIVLRDRLLVIVPDGADSILIDLERRVRGGITEMENQVFGKERAPKSSVTSTVKKSSSSAELINNDGTHQLGESDKKDSTLSEKTDVVSSDDDIVEEECNDEWEELQKMNWDNMPFELQSVDAVLQTVTAMLMVDARKVHHRSTVAMSELRGDAPGQKRSGPGEHAQERLRLHKDEVKMMESRVQGFVRAMNEVLDDDEDMTLMNLSRLLTHPERFLQPVPEEVLHEESDEPELILEVYLQQALSIVNEMDLLKGQILTTEEQLSMQLDAIRNRLLFINTLLSVASLCVTIGSFVGSIFGMNLKNHFEDDPTAFTRVTAGTVVGMILAWAILSRIFQRAASTRSNWKSE
jgi:magnesium transporter